MPARFATIGNFDGVHAGHRHLLSELKRAARTRGMTPAAFVLTSHPLSIIAPERIPPQLTTPQRRLALIENEGVEAIPLQFSEDIRRLSSREFMAKISDEFGIKGLMIGYDHKFGSDREATFSDYVGYGREMGLTVIEAPELSGHSSSAIRKALLSGHPQAAAEMLGYPYRLSGSVIHGMHLGSKIGFPTANMQPSSPLLLIPARGVYATIARIDGNPAPIPAVTNIGVRPTVSEGDAPLSIETHIPGFTDDIYDREISLDFIDRIRDEQRFNSLEELKAQLARDVAEATHQLINRHSGSYYSDDIIAGG